MKTSLKITAAAIAATVLVSFGGSSFAQTTTESPFDSIQSDANAAASNTAVPASQDRLQLVPSIETAPRIAPNFDPSTGSAPQPYLAQPVPNNPSISPAYQQPTQVVQSEPLMYVQPAPLVLPPTCNRLPKLQFSGRLIPGVGMQVIDVVFGGVAYGVGLEPGDVIVQIDGRRIANPFDYENALLNAAIYQDGHVDLVVRNVRYQPGCRINQEFVQVHADLPSRCYVPEVIAAR